MMNNQSKKLSEKQQSIVALNTYPQYLRAGAGTGKTEVLIQKIIHIISSDTSVRLNNFGIITFTNKATEEMKGRLSDELYRHWLNAKQECKDNIRDQLEITSMIDICTIHSFCERLLRQYGLHIGLSPNFTIKSLSKKSTEIILHIVNENYDNHLLNNIPHFKISKLISLLLHNNSNNGIVIDDYMLENLKSPIINNNYWNAFKNLILTMYNNAYKDIEKEKSNRCVLTPNDLIRKAAELLQLPYVAKRVALKYKYLFIDEFQDTNKDQFNLVETLIQNDVNVFLVGDDKQSIYAFRGADVENSRQMHDMVSCFNDIKTSVYLDENYRSSKDVIDIINRIFSHRFMYGNEQLAFPVEPLISPHSALQGYDIQPLKITFAKPVTDIVNELIQNATIGNKPVEYGDVAVLCRRNFDLDRIANELKSNGIPTVIVGGKGFYKSKAIIDTYKILNGTLNTDKRYKSELCFTDYYNAIKLSLGNISFENFIQELTVILRQETVEEALTFMFEKSDILKYYEAERNYQAVSNLFKLKDISRTLMDKDNIQPLQFLDYLSIMISTNQEEDEADIPEVDRQKGVVTLYSIHKAKGLSFPIVIIPCVDTKLNRPITKPKIILDIKSKQSAIGFDKDFINSELPIDAEYQRLLSTHTKEQLEEEIRIFYVGCTRAKNQIILATNNPRYKINNSIRYGDSETMIKWLLEVENGRLLDQFSETK